MTAPSPPTKEALGRHVPAELDDARLARQLAGIAARVAAAEARRPARRAAVTASALGLVALVVFAFARGKTPDAHPASAASSVASPVVAGAVIETAAGGETLTLLAGARAVLEPRSRLALDTVRPELVRVSLERGGLELDVEAEGAVAKTFVVSARDYEVRVLGARLHARLGDGPRAPGLSVEVSRGRAVVTRTDDPGSVRVLDAGETWSTAGASKAPPREGPAATLPPSVSPSVSPSLGAKELLARAEAARAANEPRASARLLDQLRVHHRADPRAGLAAFELGRLRLDRLGDPAGAAEAFDDALALAPDAPFAEDAEARLVEAYDAAGATAPCLAARSRYLTRHPQGVHRDKVARRCAP